MSGRLLLCSEDANLKSAVEATGMPVDVAGEAVEILERDQHRVVVMDALADPVVRAYLRSLHGPRRRDIFVVVTGEGETTGDRDRAWRESADLVVHNDDLGDIARLIAEGRDEKEAFYARFREIASAQGDS